MSCIRLLKTLSRKSLLSICATFITLSMGAQAQTITLDLQDGDVLQKAYPFGQIPPNEYVTITGTTTGDVDAVVVGLDGIIAGDAWAGSDGDIATFSLDVNDDGTFSGVLDFTLGESIAPNSVNPVTVHAFAFPDTEQSYLISDTSFNGFTASDSASIFYQIIDSLPIDNDNNGIPNASVLGNFDVSSLISPNPNDPTYFVTRDVAMLDVSNIPGFFVVTKQFTVNNQLTYVDVQVPNFEWLKIHWENDPNIDSALNAVVIIRGGIDGSFITDDELLNSGVDPSAEFNLSPTTPVYYFHVTILLETSNNVWEELELDPVLYPINIITRSFAFGNAVPDTVALYRYNTSFSQSGENLYVEGAEVGWTPVVPSEAYQTDGFFGSIALTENVKGSLYAITYILEDAPCPTCGGGGATKGDLGGSGGSSGCFIATAAYGTPMAQEVESLRDVRDTYLLHTTLGTAFVDTYYRISPPIADFIANHAALRMLVRIVLSPIVLLAQLLLSSPMWVLAGMSAASLVLLRKQKSSTNQ